MTARRPRRAPTRRRSTEPTLPRSSRRTSARRSTTPISRSRLARRPAQRGRRERQDAAGRQVRGHPPDEDDPGRRHRGGPRHDQLTGTTGGENTRLVRPGHAGQRVVLRGGLVRLQARALREEQRLVAIRSQWGPARDHHGGQPEARRRLPPGVLPRPRPRPGQGPVNRRSGARPLQVVPAYPGHDRAHGLGARRQGEEVVRAARSRVPT